MRKCVEDQETPHNGDKYCKERLSIVCLKLNAVLLFYAKGHAKDPLDIQSPIA
jgi:hypothetical protein